MSNTLHPRIVPPLSILRWMKQAGELMARDVTVWAIIAGTIIVLHCLAINSRFLAGIIIVTTYFLGITIAASLDQTVTPSLSSLLLRIWKTLPYALALSIMLAFAKLMITWSILPAKWVGWNLYLPALKAAVMQLENPWQVARFIGHHMLTEYTFLTMLLWLHVVVRIFQYPCIVLAGLDWRSAYRIGHGGWANFGPVGCLFIVVTIVPLLVLNHTPFLLLMYLPFASTLTYVAYRDIYNSISENCKKRVKAPAYQASQIARNPT